MCLIVDANVASDFFCAKAPHYKEVFEAVLEGRCCVYYGGKLRREYAQMRTVLLRILSLDKAGRAKVLPDNEIDQLTANLTRANVCKSNDAHVIALAMVANSRLLCTNDQFLQDDFTNKDLLAKPRGKVYKNSSHYRLIGVHGRRC